MGHYPLLAQMLARVLGEVIMDQTQISGVYDFELRWSPEGQNSITDPDPAPTLFTALQEKLGLHLQRQRVPVEIVVVDHCERMPVEN